MNYCDSQTLLLIKYEFSSQKWSKLATSITHIFDFGAKIQVIKENFVFTKSKKIAYELKNSNPQF